MSEEVKDTQVVSDPALEGQEGTETFDRAYVEELRRESAGHRTRAQQAERELAALKERSEKATAEHTALVSAAEQRYKDALIAGAILASAARMGYHDPADAVRLADTSTLVVENGAVTGTDAVLEALAKSKPHLIRGTAAQDASATGGRPQQTAGMNEAIRRAAGL